MDTHTEPAKRRGKHRAHLVAIACGLALFCPASDPSVTVHPLNKAVALNPITAAAQAGAAALIQHRTNILVMGVDNASRKQKTALTRSDTTILVSCDPQTRKASLISLPRDSRVAIPGHGQGKLNSAHAYGGPGLAVQTVSNAFRVPVDHYVVVDTSALRKICDMIGPLEVNVEQEMQYTDRTGNLHIDLKPGRQKLTPARVEQFVRFRHTPEADIGRIRRQQQVLMAAFKKVADPAFVVLHLPQLIATFSQCVKTDLSLDQIGKLALFGVGLQDKDIAMSSLPGRPANIHRASYWIVNSAQANVLLNRLLGRTARSP